MKAAQAIWASSLSFLLYCSALQTASAADETTRLAQLHKFWTDVQAAVQNGDYERYKATCHPSGVLVSGAKMTSYPLSKALAGWKQGFLDAKSGVAVDATLTIRAESGTAKAELVEAWPMKTIW